MIKSTYVKSKQQYNVAFELPQERVGESRDVRVLGDFNDWSWDNGIKLDGKKGTYTGSTELPAGHYQFRYLVDGQHWANDDQAHGYTDSGHGSENCCFSLDQVSEEKAPAKKAPAKKEATTKKAPAKASAKTDKSEEVKIEAATSAPATKPVVTPQDKAPAKKETTKKEAAPKKADSKKPAAKKTAKIKTDDLKKIEGIGPKIAGLLNEGGINTFADLAKANEKQIADVLQAAGARFRLAKHDTWQEQAQLAADGKMDALKKLQEELKGGKR